MHEQSHEHTTAHVLFVFCVFYEHIRHKQISPSNIEISSEASLTYMNMFMILYVKEKTKYYITVTTRSTALSCITPESIEPTLLKAKQ